MPILQLCWAKANLAHLLFIDGWMDGWMDVLFNCNIEGISRLDAL